MAKKQKKNLTASQKQRRYRVIQKSAFYGQFASIGAPYVIMGAVNFDEWFKTTEGWKVGLGGSIALALLTIAVLSINKVKEDKDNKTNGFVKMLITWLAIAFVLILLRNIIDQIAHIMLFGAIGIAGALGLEFTSKKYGDLADSYARAKVEERDESIREEVRAEKQREKAEKQNQRLNETRRRATE